MTTDKKSSLSERLKAIRDKVAGAIAAAEEEESSVAELVSPDETAENSPAQEIEKEVPARRASNDEIASALMKFTWANEQPEIGEVPEEVKAFYEDRHSADAQEADPEIKETLPESALEEEDHPEAAMPAAEEAHTGSDRWDRIIAEAEALLEKNTIQDTEPDLDENSMLASEAEPAIETDTASQPEQENHRESNETADISEGSRIGNTDSRLTQERESGFSWADLFGGIQDQGPTESAVDAAETEKSRQGHEPETAEPASEAAEPEGSGIAALLASFRKSAEKKTQKDGEEKQGEETPDISIFLQDFEENSSEPDSGEYEPDPSDVARLWEPHTDTKQDADLPRDPALDPSREETHVFTEEDLKNFPKEDRSDGTGEVSEYQDTDEEDEEGYSPRDFRPIRRRRFYRTGLVGGIMYFLFVLCVSVTLACFAWLAADDVLSLNKEYMEAEVYVGEDMDVEQVATELKTKGLIRYRRLFTLFGKFFHAEEKIEPGTYMLSTKLDYRALIQNMHHYTGWTGEELATVKVTIPEGKTVMETFQILAEHGVCPYETLMECAAKETFEYSFLTDIPTGDATRLEGYLFPDTYEFYADSSPKAAICRFLDNFGTRIGDRVMEQAAAQGYTLREIITVASLIEKEAGNDLERATIASVIYNRLQSTSFPYLQIDATIQYAMGEHKEHLTNDDLEIDSPYNTYLYPGLPPGPIANPGLASIRAALNPESTGYYFYALNKNGKHEFFKDYNAFLRFINSSEFGG